MLRPEQIREFCARRYPRFLRSLVTGESFFPLDVPFGRVTANCDHVTLNREVKALAESRLGYRVEWGRRMFRLLGEQSLPVRIWFEQPSEYVKALGKEGEVKDFEQNVDRTLAACPQLLGVVAEQPLRMADNSSIWLDILRVCSYFQMNPHPQQFARQLPIEVGTKFIDEHKNLLDVLLSYLVKVDKRTGRTFEERYDLLFDEPLLRLRVLDAPLATSLSLIAPDVSFRMSDARNLDWHHLNVIITENKMNFLTIPALGNSVAVWGGGNAAQNLASLPWLNNCRVLYWGDIDTHGFHIVSRLRSLIPHLETVMMDAVTLDNFLPLTVAAKPVTYEETIMLTPEEHATYLRVRKEQRLLEQEKIPFHYSAEQLKTALGRC